MLETLTMILAGYAGYADWPWWSATILGASAGAWNVCYRFFFGRWGARLESVGADRSVTLRQLGQACFWTGSIAAALFTGIYFVVRWIAS